MTFPQRAVSVWFGKARAKDAQYLQKWREAPLTYSPRQPIDSNWHMDRYETVLGRDDSGNLFRRAAELTLKNRFYPPEVLVNTSDFGLENRPVQVGDRIIQRIRLLQIGERPLWEVLTMNEITEVIDEPRRAGFTYTTTASHSEIGEWSPVVEWRPSGEVVLIIEVISRTKPGMSPFARRQSRRLQLRAHQLSIQNFVAQLKGEPRPVTRQAAAIHLEYLPVGMLAAALALLFVTAWFYFNGSQGSERSRE